MLWLVRLRHWVTHPPSRQRMRLILAVAALCFAIIVVEWAGWWPEGWAVNGGRPVPMMR